MTGLTNLSNLVAKMQQNVGEAAQSSSGVGASGATTNNNSGDNSTIHQNGPDIAQNNSPQGTYDNINDEYAEVFEDLANNDIWNEEDEDANTESPDIISNVSTNDFDELNRISNILTSDNIDIESIDYAKKFVEEQMAKNFDTNNPQVAEYYETLQEISKLTQDSTSAENVEDNNETKAPKNKEKTADNAPKDKEVVTEISASEAMELLNAADILLGSNASEEDIEYATNFVEEQLGKEFDTSDSKIANYVPVLENLSNLETIKGDIDSIDFETLDYSKNFTEQSAIDAVSNATSKAYQLSDEELAQIKTSAMMGSSGNLIELTRQINEENGVAPMVTNLISNIMTDLEHSFEIGFNWENAPLDEGGYENRGEMLKFGGYVKGAWCDYFASSSSGIDEFKQIFPNANTELQVAALRANADEKGVYSSIVGVDPAEAYQPVAGDFMILEQNGASHVAIVIDSDDEYIYTIEGNADDAVRAKKYAKPNTSEFETSNGKYNDISGYVRTNEAAGGTGTPVCLEYMPKELFQLAVKHEDTI